MTKKLHISCARKGAQTRGKKISLKDYKDLVILAVTFGIIPPLEKAKKQGEMPLTGLSPIPYLNSTFYNGMGLSLHG